jgi:hypothetical protein
MWFSSTMAVMRARRVCTPLLLGLLTFSPLTASALPGTAPAEGAASPTGAYRHDGFYLRMGIGLAYGLIKGSGTLVLAPGDPGSDTTLTYKGWGPAFELLIGKAVGRGFVAGAGVVGQRIWEPKVTKEFTLRVRSDATYDHLGEGSINVGLVGPFLDWFPREDGGLHFGAMVGAALLGIAQGHTGVAGSLWGGYDFWISSQWSLGIVACIAALQSAHSLSGYGGTLDDGAINASLLFTALYN